MEDMYDQDLCPETKEFFDEFLDTIGVPGQSLKLGPNPMEKELFNEFVLVSYHLGNQIHEDDLAQRLVDGGLSDQPAAVLATHYAMTFDFLALQTRRRRHALRRLPEVMGWD